MIEYIIIFFFIYLIICISLGINKFQQSDIYKNYYNKKEEKYLNLEEGD